MCVCVRSVCFVYVSVRRCDCACAYQVVNLRISGLVWIGVVWVDRVKYDLVYGLAWSELHRSHLYDSQRTTH